MIEIRLRTVHQKGIVPDHAEAFGEWAITTPVTKDEYEKFVEEMDKAKKMARQIYLKSNGLIDADKFQQEEA